MPGGKTGQVAGNSNTPHPALFTLTVVTTVGEDPPSAQDLVLEGALPTFTTNITGGGVGGTLAWANAAAVLASQTFMLTDPIPIDIEFEFSGLVGNLVLTAVP